MFEYFTRRYCLDRPNYDLKYEYIPPSLRSDFYKLIHDETESITALYCFYRDASVVVNRDSARFYSHDDIAEYFNPDILIEMLLTIEWHEFLSITEFASNEVSISIAQINNLFEYHRIGYRLERNHPNGKAKAIIHYDTLIADAKVLLDKNIEYEGVINSVESAYKMLSNSIENNVELAVKASVDAVEGYLRGWLSSKGHTTSTLGKSVDILKKYKLAPHHIIASLEKLYIFRNTEPNVGHGAPEKGNLQLDDALLCFEMAISFINYFYRKSQKDE